MVKVGNNNSNVTGLFVLIGYLYILVRKVLNTWWLRLNVFLVQRDGQIPPSTKTCHKIVVIGDSIAAGAGDWVTLGEVGGVGQQIQTVSILN